MQVTLTFTGPDAENDARMALNASRYHSMLWEIDQGVRRLFKHSEPTAAQVRELVLEAMSDFDRDEIP